VRDSGAKLRSSGAYVLYYIGFLPEARRVESKLRRLFS